MAAGQLNKAIEHLRSVLVKQNVAGITDGDLVKRYVGQHDEAAFEAVLRRHGPMVLGVCRRRSWECSRCRGRFPGNLPGPRPQSDTLRSPGLVGNWLYGVAHRTALGAKKASAKRRAMERQMSPMPQPESANDARDEMQALLEKELASLPEKYRVVLVLCDLEGKPRRQAAQQLGWPQGTVASQLTRARALLAKRLTRQGLRSRERP